MSPFRCLIPFAVLLLLAACGSDPARQSQTPRIGDFGIDLAAEYQAFSESEAELGREAAAEHFGLKARDARDTGDVEPELPQQWTTEGSDEQDDLIGARTRLLNLRDGFLERVSSQNLARAQVLYDCWVLQTNARNADLAAECRSGFLTAIRQLESVHKTRNERKKPSLPASFTVLFPSGGAELDRDAYYVIDQVRVLTGQFPRYSIDVAGHSDAEGSLSHNLALSRKRAEAVTQALLAAGIDGMRVDTAWLGQDDLQQPTLDGTSRQENRRVEIDVFPARTPPVTE